MKLIPRFNTESAKQVEVHIIRPDASAKEGNPDRFDRVLALWLDLQNAIQGVNWHFFQSPVTGLGGPSQPLLNALQQNGFNVIIH